MKVVRQNYPQEAKVQVPESQAEEGVEPVVYVLVEGQAAGYITLRNQVREESAEAIRVLKGSSWRTLLPGDYGVTACGAALMSLTEMVAINAQLLWRQIR